MPFTRIPSAAHSVAKVRVREAKADFDAPYAAAPGTPTSQVSEHTFTMLPPWVMRFAAVRAQKKAALRSMAADEFCMAR